MFTCKRMPEFRYNLNIQISLKADVIDFDSASKKLCSNPDKNDFTWILMHFLYPVD